MKKYQQVTEKVPTTSAVVKAAHLQAALTYAKAGFAVFPCHYIVNAEGDCSCGNKEACEAKDKRGKAPHTLHGFLEATTDEAQIRAWWTRHPRDNMGSAQGRIALHRRGPQQRWRRDAGRLGAAGSRRLSANRRWRRAHLLPRPTRAASSPGEGAYPGIDLISHERIRIVEPRTTIGGSYKLNMSLAPSRSRWSSAACRLRLNGATRPRRRRPKTGAHTTS